MEATGIGNGNGLEHAAETKGPLLLSTRLVVLDREHPSSWSLLPQVVARVKKFCNSREHHADSNAEIVARWIERDFTSEKPTVLLMVMEEAGVVVGHLLACMMKNEFNDCQYMHIWQYEVDKEGVSMDYLRGGFDIAIEWGEVHGATEVRLECSSEKLARVYMTFYGFKPWNLIMRKEIGNGQ